jgi:hypothetical protein
MRFLQKLSRILLRTAIFFFMACNVLMAQTPFIEFADVKAMKKGAVNLKVVHSDETGIYLLDSDDVNSNYNVISYPFQTIPKILKIDRDFKLVYETPLLEGRKRQNLKGIYPLLNDLYAFSAHYDKDIGECTISAGKINKTNGTIPEGMKEIFSIPIVSKKDSFDFSIRPLEDKTGFMLLAETKADKGKDKSYYFLPVPTSLKKIKAQPFKMPRTGSFQINDIFIIGSQHLFVQANEYTFEDIGKRKSVRKLKSVSLDVFDLQGTKVHSVSPNINDKFLIRSQLLRVNGDLYLAGSYCNTEIRDEIHGLFIAKMDKSSYALAEIKIIPLQQKLLGIAYMEEMEKEKTRSEKKNDHDQTDDGLHKNINIRKLYAMEDGGFIVVAERAWAEDRKVVSISSRTGEAPSTRESLQTFIYTNELIVMKLTHDGQVHWVNVLPKNQVQIYSKVFGMNNNIDFLYNNNLWPAYGSASLWLENNNLYMIFNDSKKNAEVTEPGRKVSTVSEFDKCEMAVVSCDLKSGKLTRNQYPYIKNKILLMPLNSFEMNGEILIPAAGEQFFGGVKGDLKFGILKFK